MQLWALCASTRRRAGTVGYVLGLMAVARVSRGSRGGRWSTTGGTASTWSWTRSGGCAPGSLRRLSRSRRGRSRPGSAELMGSEEDGHGVDVGVFAVHEAVADLDDVDHVVVHR